MARQYVSVRFRPWDKRTYTYHWDGEPVNVGEEVKVGTRDGLATVSVEAVTEVAPPYETKPLAGKDGNQDDSTPPPPPRRKRPDKVAEQGSFLRDIEPSPVVGFGDGDEPIWREDQ